MAAYLAEHVPHLQKLHLQLGLPPEALQSDESKIETAIRNAVTSLIRDREGEVDGWKDAIADVRRSMVSVGRALGEKGRDAVSAARRESENSLEALPMQHEKLLKQKDALEREYDDRLAKINTVRSQIEYFAALLGPPFESPQPLQPIAGPSRAQPEKTVTRKISTNSLFRRTSATAPPPPMSEDPCTSWYNVGDDMLEVLQAELQKAMDERELRYQQLLDHFVSLAFLHAELGLPPVPLAQPHHFPIQLLPVRATEERPGSHALYEKTLSRYITANAGHVMSESGATSCKGLEETEPEIGLLNWAEEINGLWTTELDSRMARIQALYDQLEPLWSRLEVDKDQQDLFMEMNHGCSEAVVKAYEVELERCLELRKTSLSSFVIAARKEIELLWEELMLGEDEMGEFGAFIDDDYTEDLLQDHEDEAERLRAEIESKASMLPRVRDWHALKADEEELERTQNDPNRFSARGGAMLREEKLRKRVTILLPRIENELLSSLPIWEEANGRPFMVQGERVIDKIADAQRAKEEAKEAKKRAKMGLGPTKGALAPARTVKATPAPSTVRRPPPSMMSTMSRKREAPTPTPIGAAGLKRQKLAIPPSTLKPMGKLRITSQPIRPTPVTSPTSHCGVPRAVSHNSARTVSSSTAVSYTSSSTDRTRVPSLTLVKGDLGIKPAVGLGRAEGKGPRRQSFKPRQSQAGNLIVSIKARRSSTGWSVREEDEEAEDVF